MEHSIIETILSMYILHLLYETPIQRGRTTVIEDLPPLYDIKVSLKLDKNVRNAYLLPQKEEVSFEQKNGILGMIIPKMQCHQAIVLNY